jgi:hypothetical protein
MGLHDPSGLLKHKLWPKEGPEVKLPTTKISRPLKVKNHPDFLVCKWRAMYRWKALDDAFNFALKLISIESLHPKLWAPKVARVPILWISGFPLKNPRTKWHLGDGLVAKHRVHYKGEVDGFPQVRTMVTLMNLCLLVACPWTKNVPTLHWPTCCLVCACLCEWLTHLLLILVPSQSSNTPLYP